MMTTIDDKLLCRGYGVEKYGGCDNVDVRRWRMYKNHGNGDNEDADNDGDGENNDMDKMVLWRC